MSWIDKYKQGYIITTGDGKKYKPLWLNAQKALEFNVAVYDFPNIAGSKVERGTPRGTQYNFEIYFSGTNHLDNADAFYKSAANKNAWTIEHPLYGTLKVHPTTLEFDNSAYNVTKIAGTIIETITDDLPKTAAEPTDKITTDTDNCNEDFAQAYATNANPSATDVAQMKKNTSNAFKLGEKSISDTLDFENYYNALNNANSYITSATDDPLSAMRAIQTFINYPAKFQSSVQSRLNIFNAQFTKLRETIAGALSPSLKMLYENNAAAILSGMALTTVTNISSGDYGNRNTVLNIAAQILAAHNAFIADLDKLQTLNGGSPTSYIPNAVPLRSINLLINYTIANLFAIAANTKQERSIVLTEDTNIIPLAHQLYGLLPDDSTIDLLIESNNIGENELLQLKKERKIIYYV